MPICLVTSVLIKWSINKAAVVVEARDFLLGVSCGTWTHHDRVKDKQLGQIDGLREAWRRWWWSREQLQTTATDASHARSTLCMHAQWESLCLAQKKKTEEMSENGRTKEVRRMSVLARMCHINTRMDSCFVLSVNEVWLNFLLASDVTFLPGATTEYQCMMVTRHHWIEHWIWFWWHILL